MAARARCHGNGIGRASGPPGTRLAHICSALPGGPSRPLWVPRYSRSPAGSAGTSRRPQAAADARTPRRHVPSAPLPVPSVPPVPPASPSPRHSRLCPRGGRGCRCRSGPAGGARAPPPPPLGAGPGRARQRKRKRKWRRERPRCCSRPGAAPAAAPSPVPGTADVPRPCARHGGCWWPGQPCSGALGLWDGQQIPQETGEVAPRRCLP